MFEQVTPLQIAALKRILGIGVILVDLDKVDYTRGRVKTKENCYKMWTTDRKRIDVSAVMHGQDSPALIASQTREAAEDWPTEPVFPEQNRQAESDKELLNNLAPLFGLKPPYPGSTSRPCINPFCTQGNNGTRATVDITKKKSGACCKACMNYECAHPDCVARAEANGWPRATHPWGTKIAEHHKEWRKKEGNHDG